MHNRFNRRAAQAIARRDALKKVAAMTEADPSFWQTISGWLWALLAIPLKMLWSKADNAASKDDLAEAIDAAAKASSEARQTMRDLFSNAERDRADNSRRFAEVQSEQHKTYVELRDLMDRSRKVS